jgi:hypothetical protein
MLFSQSSRFLHLLALPSFANASDDGAATSYGICSWLIFWFWLFRYRSHLIKIALEDCCIRHVLRGFGHLQ